MLNTESLKGLKLQRRAGLNPIRILAVLVEADNGCILQKTAAGQRPIRTKRFRRSVGISRIGEQRVQPQKVDEWRTGETEKPSVGIQAVFKRSSRIFGKTAARRRLAHEQRRGNNAVEQSETSAKHNLMRTPDVVGQADARVHVLPLRVEHTRRPSFKLPAHATVQSKFL